MRRRLLLALALLLFAGPAFAGATDYVGSLPREVCSRRLVEPGTNSGPYGAICGTVPFVTFTGTDGRSRTYIPKGWSLEITHVSMAVNHISAGSESCLFTLAYSADGTGSTGTDLTGSEIYLDDAFDCDGTAAALDAIGKSCFKRTAPLLLTEGAWMHWKYANGAGSCDLFDVYNGVYGVWRKNG